MEGYFEILLGMKKKSAFDNFSGGDNFILKFEHRFRKFEKFPKSFSKHCQNQGAKTTYNSYKTSSTADAIQSWRLR